jgi:Spy/CpxP family protein refolding chaperone
LTQDKVDRVEIEKFRAEQLALADAFSKRVSQAIGEAAEILTPEQRRKLADRLPPGGHGPGSGPRWNR